MDILDNEIKNCTTTHKYKVKKRKIWITNGLIKSMCTRDKMYQKLLKEPDNIALKQNYTQYKNYVRNLLRVTKLQYYRNKIQENAQNSSNLWNTVNEICPKNNRSSRDVNVIQHDGKKETNEKHIANIFNEHYSKIGEKLAEKIYKDPNFTPPKKK
ncbi:hypothetical protein JTB14_000638 [Gonioctena quinquepunctata]|nr:hypothetical protein JTB14_000638 [Gonioctena quinquepunctata]